jgi:hypothetical protein
MSVLFDKVVEEVIRSRLNTGFAAVSFRQEC